MKRNVDEVFEDIKTYVTFISIDLGRSLRERYKQDGGRENLATNKRSMPRTIPEEKSYHVR